jgi:hypothetical protein
MKLENCKRKKGIKVKGRKHISIRVSDELSKWMREKELSPTGIFNEAVKELGYKFKD